MRYTELMDAMPLCTVSKDIEVDNTGGGSGGPGTGGTENTEDGFASVKSQDIFDDEW